MSDLIEAMARDIFHAAYGSGWEKAEQGFYRRLATAALAALRETHHLVPKDQEPDAWRIDLGDNDYWFSDVVENPVSFTCDCEVRQTPLYALEKRHD